METRRPVIARLAGIALALVNLSAWAELPPPAYLVAAHKARTPPELLYALAMQESNAPLLSGYLPWPWTLNVDGQSLRFHTRDGACTAIKQALISHGPYKVDIGLTQQNWGFVGKDWFKHPCAALNPYDNLNAAATQLRQYYEQTGDWITAAGKYHRPAGGAPARRYRAAIRKRLQQLCPATCSGLLAIK